jgi:hypothetical protein
MHSIITLVSYNAIVNGNVLPVVRGRLHRSKKSSSFSFFVGRR